MTGQLPAASGTLANPGYAFNGDLDTGRYRSGANAFSDVCGGTAVVSYTSTAITFAVPVSGVGAMPVGSVTAFAGATAPSGWLFCVGQEVSRTTYAALDAVLGTTYGAYTNGSGSAGTTHMRLPDLRGRVIAGPDNMNGTSDQGRLSKAGANRLVLGGTIGLDGVILAIVEMPAHDHNGATGAEGAHSHTYSQATESAAWNVTSGGVTLLTGTSTQGTGSVGNHQHAIASQGGGTSHLNVQPSLMMNSIIYTGVA